MAVTTADITAVQKAAKRLADDYLSRLSTATSQLTSHLIGSITGLPDYRAEKIVLPVVAPTRAQSAPTAPNLPQAPSVPSNIAITPAAVPVVNALQLPTPPTPTTVTIDTTALTNAAVQNIQAPTLSQVQLPVLPALLPTDGIRAAIQNRPQLTTPTQVAAPVLTAIADPVFLDTAPVSPFSPNVSTIGTAASLTSAVSLLADAGAIVPTEFLAEPYVVDSIEGAVKDAISRGLSGNGFATSQETLLIQQAAGRMADEIADASNRAARDLAARGFSAPTGLLFAAQRKAAKEARRDFLAAYTDIVGKESQMNRQDVATALSAGLTYIDMLRKFHLALIDVAFKAWTAIAEFKFRAYDASLAKARAQDEFNQIRIAFGSHEIAVEQMRLEAAKMVLEENRYVIEANKNILAVYEAKSRIQSLKVDLYAAEVEASKATLSLNAQLLDIYKAELSAETTVIDVNKNILDGYKAELSGALAVNDLNKSTVDIYRAQLEADKGRISLALAQAEAAWKQADAQMQADKNAIDIYTAQVRAEEARVSAEAAVASASIARNRAEIDIARSNIDLYRLQLTAHEAQVSDLLSSYKVETSTYAAALQEAARIDNVQAQNARAAIDVSRANAQLAIERTRGTIEKALKVGSLSTDQFRFIAELSAQVASSAMQGQQTMLELSSKVFE